MLLGIFKTPLPIDSPPQVIERYVLPGSESEVNLPSALRSACQASVEQRVSLLSKAQEEILLLLAFDTYPRFLKSAAYAAMIAELSSGVAAHPSAQVDLCLSGSSHRYGGSASAFSGEPSDGGVPVPSEEPLSWLERFIRLADLLPGCITLAEVRISAYPPSASSFHEIAASPAGHPERRRPGGRV